MSSALDSVWKTLVGLLVDDGQLAIGIVGALALSWAFAAFGPEDLRNRAGWLLLLMLLMLVLTNLNRVGRRAQRSLRGTTKLGSG